MAELKAKIGLETSAFETGLARLENAAGGFAKGLGGIFVGAFSFTAIFKQFSDAIAKASQLQDISDRFGISAEALQKIGNAAIESGASLEDVGTALGKIGVAAQEAAGGNEKLQETFARIGVSVGELTSLSPEQLFYRLSAAMKDGRLAGQDLATAKELLGRGFMSLLPVLKMTEEQIQQVAEASGVMSDDAVAKLDAFADSWGRLSNTVKVKAAEIADASIRLGEEIMANPLSLFGDWQEIEKRIEQRQQAEKKAREALRQPRIEPDADSGDISKTFQKERDRMNVAEARQELRMIEAGIAGAAAAERIMANFTPEVTGQRQSEQVADTPRSFMQVLADSLQQVGGGGRFAQIGGVDNVQRDQLNVLKNIEKNTSKEAKFDGKSYDIFVK